MIEWLKSKLQPTPVLPTKVPALPQTAFTVTGPSEQKVSVSISSAEIAERASAHAFVLDLNPAPLKAADQWWEEESQKRRIRDRSDKAYAWLSPFIPQEFAKLEQLEKVLQQGPHSVANLAKALRALIREKRKNKESHTELLKALYGACVLADFSGSLGFEGTQPHTMARFVSLEELAQVQCDYATLGYQCIEALGKTDVKWLVEAFGEPSEHQSFDAAFPSVRRNAVARYCWTQVRISGRFRDASINPKAAMQEWLNELVKINIGYYKEWQDRVAARTERLAEQSMGIAAAWVATNQPYAVADLETTGFSAVTDEILEFAAALVEPTGAITAEFSVLVRINRPVPAAITKLTGITQDDIVSAGVPLPVAYEQFLAFIGNRPVFFHNAPFDAGFLKQAAVMTNRRFVNTVHDTLPMARAAWPELDSYRLSVLAGHVGAPAPTHRGLADVKATLAVMLAARR